MLVCPQCGAEITLEDVGEPCTNCGITIPLDMELEAEEEPLDEWE